jgi:hypothetical protein
MGLHSLMFLVVGLLIAADAPKEGEAKNGAPIPGNLMPSKRNIVLFQVSAEGFQIYTCKAKADESKKFEWTLKLPDASLFNDEGKKIGKHYGGPTWEGSDGSKVISMLIETAPAPKDGDIPWLLLKAKENLGKGLFSRVTYIQRLNTEGGVAPAKGCDKAQEGNEVRVKYKATYIFYGTEK